MSAIARRIIPLLDRVLIEKIAAPAQTAGGILLPESAQDKPVEGIVVAVGEGRYSANGTLIPTPLKAGDKVIVPEYGGSKIKVDGQELTMYRTEEIVAKVTD